MQKAAGAVVGKKKNSLDARGSCLSTLVLATWWATAATAAVAPPAAPAPATAAAVAAAGLIVHTPFERDGAGAAFKAFLSRGHLRALLFQDGFARQPDAVALDGEHLDQHLVAFLQFVANVLDAVLRNFADVQQAV